MMKQACVIKTRPVLLSNLRNMDGIIRTKLLVTLLSGLLFGGCTGRSGQEKVNIYPIPQKLELSGDWIKIPKTGYRLEGINLPDTDAVSLLKQSFLITEQAKQTITIRQLEKAESEMQRSGAYTLNVTEKGIRIGICDDRSLFYAAQTLSQLIKDEKKLPVCTIWDYPDIVFRGVVEGFYRIREIFQDWPH